MMFGVESCVLSMVRVKSTTTLFVKVENLLMIDLFDYGYYLAPPTTYNSPDG